MSWNYRVVKFTDKWGDHFEVVEAYYHGSLDESRPNGWCSAGSVSGDDLDEAKRQIERMAGAFDKPVLIAADLGWAQPDIEGPRPVHGLSKARVVEGE